MLWRVRPPRPFPLLRHSVRWVVVWDAGLDFTRWRSLHCSLGCSCNAGCAWEPVHVSRLKNLPSGKGNRDVLADLAEALSLERSASRLTGGQGWQWQWQGSPKRRAAPGRAEGERLQGQENGSWVFLSETRAPRVQWRPSHQSSTSPSLVRLKRQSAIRIRFHSLRALLDALRRLCRQILKTRRSFRESTGSGASRWTDLQLRAWLQLGVQFAGHARLRPRRGCKMFATGDSGSSSGAISRPELCTPQARTCKGSSDQRTSHWSRNSTSRSSFVPSHLC